MYYANLTEIVSDTKFSCLNLVVEVHLEKVNTGK